MECFFMHSSYLNKRDSFSGMKREYSSIMQLIIYWNFEMEKFWFNKLAHIYALRTWLAPVIDRIDDLSALKMINQQTKRNKTKKKKNIIFNDQLQFKWFPLIYIDIYIGIQWEAADFWPNIIIIIKKYETNTSMYQNSWEWV